HAFLRSSGLVCSPISRLGKTWPQGRGVAHSFANVLSPLLFAALYSWQRYVGLPSRTGSASTSAKSPIFWSWFLYEVSTSCASASMRVFFSGKLLSAHASSALSLVQMVISVNILSLRVAEP